MSHPSPPRRSPGFAPYGGAPYRTRQAGLRAVRAQLDNRVQKGEARRHRRASLQYRFKASEAQHHSASLSPVPAAARAGAMASQSDLSAANASAEPRRTLGSLRMVWQHASRYPLHLIVAAIALGLARKSVV